MSDVPINKWWKNKRIKIFINRYLSLVNKNWEPFVDSNFKSFCMVLIQGLLIGVLLQAIIALNLQDHFISFRLFFLTGFSAVCLFILWAVYAFVVSKLYIRSFSRGVIFEILKYDAFSYIPFTISMLIWIVFYFINVPINITSWLVLTGLTPVIFLKILIFFYKKPNRDIATKEKAQEIKEKHVDNVNDLDADLPYSLMFEKEKRGDLRKYIVNDEVRNAFNITNLKNDSIKIMNKSSFDVLNYSIGWPNKEIFSEGNLKLYLDDGKSQKMIFNKNAENFLKGWNEYQISLPSKVNEISLRWENNIKKDIYLSISKLSSTNEKRKQKKKNIIIIIFDGVRPETIGLYMGGKNADEISRFFSKSPSLMFKNSYVQGEWTMPNFATIASSLYQSHHRIFDPDLFSSQLPKNYKTLAEILQENGYKTLGYVGHNRVSPGYGHARGFDKFFYRLTRRKPGYDHKDILFTTIRFLKENKDSNNFIFLHVFDTHSPHFQTPSNISNVHDALFNSNVNVARETKELGKDGLLFLQEIYDQKFKEVDSDFSILFDYISKYENDCTSVIFATDHGVVYFDEDMNNAIPGGEKSGRDKYLIESMLKAPLIVRLPPEGYKNKFNVRDDIVEGNLTIMPTVLEIAGIKPPDYIDGVSIFKNTDKKVGKNYAIAESNYKNRYELFIKTNEYEYFLKTKRNRATGEIQKTDMHEEFFNSKAKKIKDMKIKNKIKENVKKLVNENKLPDIFNKR